MSNGIRIPATNATKPHDAVQSAKSVLTGVHGMGESIRGSFNQAVDTAFGDKTGEVKNEAVTEKGLNEMNDGEYRGHSERVGEKFDGVGNARVV
ncbi:hypothetical protein MMC30_005422 [Trapelia coarctata]|nr:hypothetical protein [Trapelia coarctata]